MLVISVEVEVKVTVLVVAVVVVVVEVTVVNPQKTARSYNNNNKTSFKPINYHIAKQITR